MPNMIPPTRFAVALSCMSNHGARAKSLGSWDCEATARRRFRDAYWTPLGHGSEWSRYATLTRVTVAPGGAVERTTIETRSLDPVGV